MPDYPDLPPVSQDPDVPLPDVAPDSALVPYRIGSKAPGGDYQYTTGYGPRGRPPIQPPVGMGGGVGAPDMGPLISAAFEHLPVDQAIQAVDAASRYVGQRLYSQALARGDSVEKAWAANAPMMLKSGAGIPEVIRAQLERERRNTLTAQQMIQNRFSQQKFQASQEASAVRAEAAKAKLESGKNKMHVLSSGEVLQETGDPDNPIKVVKPRGVTTSTADKDIDYQIKAQGLMGLKPTELATDPSYQQRTNLAAEIIKRHPLIQNAASPKPAQTPPPVAGSRVTTKEQFDALPSGTVYTGKDGKKYRKP